MAAAIGMSFPQSLFLGTALAITALPVSVRILLDLNLLNSRLGRAIVSVALANDLVAFGMLGLVVQFTAMGNTTPEATTSGFPSPSEPFTADFSSRPSFSAPSSSTGFGMPSRRSRSDSSPRSSSRSWDSSSRSLSGTGR